jgi:eukaryotic-like serine/threonine-protein kinase
MSGMSGTASPLVAPGAIVAGKYRLDTIVGEGGMGAVWSATHTGLGQLVAIKFISKDFVNSPEALRRFDAEAKAAAQLRSRHVVQVFDNGTLEDGTPYIAMELLRGENVYSRVHRAGPVALNEAVEILWQCTKALGRAHAAGIIHRDIKPDNIFLAQSDEEAILVKILDFGIAKFAANPNDHGSTRTGAVLGTPLYMSPEQARGLKTIDHRTDLYSLGLVAYTMFTGNLAFSSESFGDLLLQICTAPLPSLCANAPWLPASMEQWFQRACARDPQNRFGSAQEFADALRAACDGTLRASALPASMLQQGLPQGPGMASGGYPAHAASVATASGMSRSGDASLVAPPRQSRAPVIAFIAALLVASVGAAAFFTLGKKDVPGEAGAHGTAVATGAPPPSTPVEPTTLQPLTPTGVATGASTGTPEIASAVSVHPGTTPSASSAVASHPQPVHPGTQTAPTAPVVHPTSQAPTAGTGKAPIDLGY